MVAVNAVAKFHRNMKRKKKALVSLRYLHDLNLSYLFMIRIITQILTKILSKIKIKNK